MDQEGEGQVGEAVPAPLTRRDADGELYRRTADVEEQIREALSLCESELIDRAGLRDFESSQYLGDECLIYLIRRFHRDSHKDGVVNTLTGFLIKRWNGRIYRQISIALAPTYFADCFSDVILASFSPILDLESDKCDFAQVRCGLWLERVTFNVLRSYWKRQREDIISDSYDKDDEDSDKKDFAETPKVLRDKTLAQDLEALCAEALSVLDEKERMVFLMRHYWEWEIQNQNPDEMTISKYFGVNPRTIHNWLNSGEAKLREWLGGRS